MASQQPPKGNQTTPSTQRWTAITAQYIDAAQRRGATFYEVSRQYGIDNQCGHSEWYNSISPRWPMLKRAGWAFRLPKPNGGFVTRLSNHQSYCFIHFSPRFQADVLLLYGPMLQALAQEIVLKQEMQNAPKGDAKDRATFNYREAQVIVDRCYRELRNQGVLFEGELLR